MKLFYFAITLILFLNIAFAEEISIEDSLASVPKSVETSIRAQKNFEFSNCKLKGQLINLTDSEKASDYVVTTSEACGWGASAGPIWVVAKLDGSYTVLLATSAYTVAMHKNKNHELHQVVTTSGTAGHASYTRWGFTGKNYKQLESYVFFPDDKKLCKAHQDICPFEMEH